MVRLLSLFFFFLGFLYVLSPLREGGCLRLPLIKLVDLSQLSILRMEDSLQNLGTVIRFPPKSR